MTGFSGWTLLAAIGWLGAAGTSMAAGCQVHSAGTSSDCAGALHLGRMQQLSARRSLAQRSATAGHRHVDGHPARVSRRLLESAGLGRSVFSGAASANVNADSRSLKSGAIFTPQLVLDGRDLRLIGGMETLQDDLAAGYDHQRQPAGAEIYRRVEPGTQGFSISAEAAGRAASAAPAGRGWIAVFENGLSSRVSQGENAGRQL